MSKKDRKYPKAPSPTPEQEKRLQAILATLTDELKVTEAAAALGLSREQVHALKNRALQGLLEAIEPQRPGPKPESDEVKELRRKLESAEKELTALRAQAERTDRLLEIVAKYNRRGVATKASDEAPNDEKDEPDPEGALLADYEELRASALTEAQAAGVVGKSPATLARWRTRLRAGEEARQRPGPSPMGPIAFDPAARIEELVRVSGGVIGARSLAVSAGVSRRAAARTKAETLTRMEQERKARLSRVEVLAPNVIRGFDPTHVRVEEETRWVMTAADGMVGYRTLMTVAETYNEADVLRFLRKDLEEHGAPLVYRLDQAKAHQTEAVRKLLEEFEVLVLHGPARYPRFYGQLERKHRDHRLMLDHLAEKGLEDFEIGVGRIQKLVNSEWPLRRLGWKTPADLWHNRGELWVDRRELRREVDARRDELEDSRGWPPGKAERRAIEAALINRGLLRREKGGWC